MVDKCPCCGNSIIENENFCKKCGHDLKVTSCDYEKVVSRDEFVLKMIIHRYDEEERRNTLIDSKINQMILFLGTILTIYSSAVLIVLFDSGLIPKINEYIEVILIIIPIISIFIIISIILYIFVDTYDLRNSFESVPEPSKMIKLHNDKSQSKRDIINGLIDNFSEANKNNIKIINKKAEKTKKGFKYLKIGIKVIFFLLLFLMEIFLFF